MPKVTRVKSARKDQGKCRMCGKEILKGMPYQHATPGFRMPKRVHCESCPFRMSHLTSSKMSDVYAALEDLEDAVTESMSLDDFESLCDDARSAVEDVVSEYEEAADAMGGAGEQMTERAEMLQSLVDHLDGAGNVEVDDDCEDCEGTGESQDQEDCGECGGTGIDPDTDGTDEPEDCSECSGEGVVDTQCLTCDGTGKVEDGIVSEETIADFISEAYDLAGEVG